MKNHWMLPSGRVYYKENQELKAEMIKLLKEIEKLQYKIFYQSSYIRELGEKIDKLKSMKYLEPMGNVNSAGFRVLGRED